MCLIKWTRNFFSSGNKAKKKTGVALLIRHRGHCEPLWAVVPPLQVELSSACSVASLGRFPSHYLPGRLCLRPGVLADHPFGWGIPSTRQAGHETVHSAPSIKSPFGAQGGMTLPNMKTRFSLMLAPHVMRDFPTSAWYVRFGYFGGMGSLHLGQVAGAGRTGWALSSPYELPARSSPPLALRPGPHARVQPGHAANGRQWGSTKELFTLLDLCVSSLRRGHANLFCSRTRVSQTGPRIPYWDPEVPQKLKEVTLMRPIHGNL